MIGLNGCSSFMPKETIIETKSDYCPKHSPLPENQDIRDDIKKISLSLFNYIKVNETTYTCDCFEGKAKEKCYNDFVQLYE